MDTFTMLYEYLKKYVRDPEAIQPDATLKGMGIDSLDMVDTMVEIEEKLHIRFEDAELMNVRTVADAVALIDSKIQKGK